MRASGDFMSSNSGQAALVLAAILSAGTLAAPLPVAAAPPSLAAPASTPQADAAQISQIMFTVVDFRSLMSKSINEAVASDDTFMLRPEWPSLLTEAAAEEFDHDRPTLIGLFANVLVENFTGEELRQGLIMMRDPEAQRVFAAAASGQDVNSLDPKFGKDFIRAAKTPAGARFMKKLGDLEPMMSTAEKEFIVELLPGMLRRFGEKAEAAEAARKAQAQ